MTVSNPLVRRFRNFTPLSVDDEARLDALTAFPQSKGPRRDLIREGDRPHAVFLILHGWACRYKMLADGRRQLLQFLLPGDLCDVHNIVLEKMDHSIGAVTEVRYTEIAHDRLDELARDAPHLRRALWWHSMTAMAMQREWTMNIGQRCASERLGHLFCELFYRLRAVELTDGSSCDMPVTQTDLGDATGLTSVHINRTLQDLRETGLIVLKGKRLTIPDLDALRDNALFSENYLHSGPAGNRSSCPPLCPAMDHPIMKNSEELERLHQDLATLRTATMRDRALIVKGGDKPGHGTAGGVLAGAE